MRRCKFNSLLICVSRLAAYFQNYFSFGRLYIHQPGAADPIMSGSGKDAILNAAPDSVKDFHDKYIAPYAFSLILGLVLIVLWLWWSGRSSEHATMPTSTFYMQQQDTVPVGGSGGGAFPLIQARIDGIDAAVGLPEGMDGDAPGAVITSAVDPSSALMPGSPSWQVLNSPAYNCSGRDLTASMDYRGYQMANMKSEGATGSRGLDDATVRTIMNGG